MNLDMYKALWEPIEINGVVIKNRISMSPMGTFAYDQDGTDSEQGRHPRRMEQGLRRPA